MVVHTSDSPSIPSAALTCDPAPSEAANTLLTPAALAFVESLAVRFGPRIAEALRRRQDRQARFDAGETPEFLSETADVRDDDWRVEPVPAFLRDRRVEITGPTDRKMMINALNSGAKVFMADLEDSTSPTWANVTEGQVNLFDAVRNSISFVNAAGKRYELDEKPAVLFVRPRGLHLPEKHVRLNGEPVPGALVDFGLFFFHNAAEQIARGVVPCFYLPKLESHLEARIWNDVFVFAQEFLGIPLGTIKATVLIETLPAAFEMDEILFELRQHSAGLNCGRWDYIFSVIKVFREHTGRVLPDRAEVGMTQPFMRAYTRLLVRTCHRRGAHAMGGMSAFIPVKNDPEANERAFASVKADKAREAGDGHDGTWVAHPGLLPVARAEFDSVLTGSNQIDRPVMTDPIVAADLIAKATGSITDEGVAANVRVGLRYVHQWINGRGCVPLYNLMEDAATAEICRSQLWQWVRAGSITIEGAPVTAERVEQLIRDETRAVRAELGADAPRLDEAGALFQRLCTDPEFVEFLTLPAYELLNG
ncbi:MAG: malate synthase A [Planctomycetota bacterium]